MICVEKNCVQPSHDCLRPPHVPRQFQHPILLSYSRTPRAQAAPHATPRVSGWHYEYGSATAFFVLPRESRQPLLAAANGDADFAAADSSAQPSRSSQGVVVTRGSCVDEVPADENGVRDVRQVRCFA